MAERDLDMRRLAVPVSAYHYEECLGKAVKTFVKLEYPDCAGCRVSG